MKTQSTTKSTADKKKRFRIVKKAAKIDIQQIVTNNSHFIKL